MHLRMLEASVLRLADLPLLVVLGQLVPTLATLIPRIAKRGFGNIIILKKMRKRAALCCIV
jgi:hypothetical protein